MENSAVYRKVSMKLRDLTNHFSAENLKEYAIGSISKSETFIIDVHGVKSEWYLLIDSNGHDESCKGHLSVSLHQESKPDTFDTTFKFGLTGANKDFTIAMSKRSKGEWLSGDGWGYPKFISHEDLCNPDKQYFVNGEVTVFCELVIFPPAKRIASENPDQLRRSVSDMFLNDHSKDCELHMNDEIVLKCHKFVLVARSPVFESMLVTSEMSDARTSVVKIEDFDSKIMTQLIRFVYGFEIEGLKDIAHGLVYAAEKYLIEELKEVCVESLIKHLSKKNIFLSLVIAEKISNSECFMNECLSFLATNIQDLKKDPGWRNLTHSDLVEIVQRMLPFFKNSRRMNARNHRRN